MPSRKIYDVVATIGEYKTGDGEIKKRYLKCGAMFENDEGNKSIKIDGLPAGSDWNGWLSLYEPREFNAPTNSPPQITGRKDDDVPF